MQLLASAAQLTKRKTKDNTAMGLFCGLLPSLSPLPSGLPIAWPGAALDMHDGRCINRMQRCCTLIALHAPPSSACILPTTTSISGAHFLSRAGCAHLEAAHGLPPALHSRPRQRSQPCCPAAWS